MKRKNTKSVPARATENKTVAPEGPIDVWMDQFAKAEAGMMEAARPLVEKLRHDPNALRHDIWLCREGSWGTIQEILVTHRGDPNDIIAYIDTDGDKPEESSSDHPEKLESGPLFTDLCAAALIAQWGGDAGDAAWDHTCRNKYGLINSYRPVPADLYGRYFSRPFVKQKDIGELGLIHPFCRFRFATMLRQFAAKRFTTPKEKDLLQVKQYIAGYIDPETGESVVAIVDVPTEQTANRRNDPTIVL